MDAGVVAALSAVGGAMVSAVAVLLDRYLLGRAEDRRHRREVAINAALRYWEQQAEVGKAWAAAGKSMKLPPLDIYVTHVLRLVTLIDERKLNADTIAGILRDVRLMTRAAMADLELEKDELEKAMAGQSDHKG